LRQDWRSNEADLVLISPLYVYSRITRRLPRFCVIDSQCRPQERLCSRNRHHQRVQNRGKIKFAMWIVVGRARDEKLRRFDCSRTHVLAEPSASLLTLRSRVCSAGPKSSELLQKLAVMVGRIGMLRFASCGKMGGGVVVEFAKHQTSHCSVNTICEALVYILVHSSCPTDNRRQQSCQEDETKAMEVAIQPPWRLTVGVRSRALPRCRFVSSPERILCKPCEFLNSHVLGKRRRRKAESFLKEQHKTKRSMPQPPWRFHGAVSSPLRKSDSSTSLTESVSRV